MGAERRVQLRDGMAAVVRPIRPEDGPQLRQGLHELSPHSRYLRFHTPISELTDRQVAYLTDVDQRDHVAWVALDPGTPQQTGMGVARYVRLVDEPEVAEAAVTVVDRYQGHGLGTLLLQIIAERAAANGITTLRNYVLEQNASMLDVLDHLGARRTPAEPGVWQVDVAVPEPHAELRSSTAGRLFRAVSAGGLGEGWENAIQWFAKGRLARAAAVQPVTGGEASSHDTTTLNAADPGAADLPSMDPDAADPEAVEH